MHRPQYWGRVQFSEAPPGEQGYASGDDEHARTQMRRIHAAAESWRSAHGQWPSSMDDLAGLWEPVQDASLSEPSLGIEEGELVVRFEQVGVEGQVRSWQLGPLCRLEPR